MTPIKEYQTVNQIITTAGGPTVYTATFPGLTAYYTGFKAEVTFNVTNGAGPVTLNFNALGALTLKNQDGTDLSASAVLTTGIYNLVYDGTNLVVTTNSSSVNSSTNSLTLQGQDKSITGTAGENITIGDVLVSGPYTDEFLDTSAFVTSSQSVGPTLMNFGQAINIPVDVTVDTVTFNVYNNGASNSNLSGNINIYAASGVPGVNGVPTGPILFSAAFNLVLLVPSTSSTITGTFVGASLTAGDYVIYIEANQGGGFGNSDISVLGDSTAPTHPGNFVDFGVADATKDMYFIMNASTTAIFVSDATTIDRSAFVGIATTTSSIGTPVTYQSEGVNNIVGTVEGQDYYLSDTPGQLSTTAGTNPVIIGRGITTDNLKILIQNVYSSISISNNTVYSAGLNGLVTAYATGAAGLPAYLDVTGSVGSSSSSLTTVVIDKDAITSAPAAGLASSVTFMVKRGQYFKVNATATTSVTSFLGSFTPINN